jgi:drug/metabolite transporter (DMT)-like permease
VALLLALLSAFTYGAADFLGGVASKRAATAVVVLLSQVAGLALLACLLPFAGGKLYPSDIALGLAGGACGSIGVGALYAALAAGRMGIVSPITAVIAASIPVLWGLGSGERPAALALAGVACAFVAVALVSANPETGRFTLRAPGVPLAFLSGLAFGGFFIVLARGHADGGLWTLAAIRTGSILLTGLYVIARRVRIEPERAVLPTILLAGALDMSANALYVFAARDGLLSIVAVIASLYPAATVVLARFILHERFAPVQLAGFGFAAGAVALIAAAR